MQHSRQIKTVEDLMHNAEPYAHFCVRNTGKMVPIVFLISSEGPIILL